VGARAAATGDVEAIAFAPDGMTYVAMGASSTCSTAIAFTPLGDREPTQVRAMLVTSSGLLVAAANRIEPMDGAQWTTVSDLSFIRAADRVERARRDRRTVRARLRPR